MRAASFAVKVGGIIWFKSGSYFVTQTGPELTLWPKLASDLQTQSPECCVKRAFSQNIVYIRGKKSLGCKPVNYFSGTLFSSKRIRNVTKDCGLNFGRKYEDIILVQLPNSNPLKKLQECTQSNKTSLYRSPARCALLLQGTTVGWKVLSISLDTIRLPVSKPF